MAIKLSNLKPKPGARRKKKRIGRGNNASNPGTYCGRGQKGQRSRSGGKKGLKIKGIKSLLRAFPKQKGFKRNSEVFEIVNLVDLENKFKDGDIVDLKSLKEKGLLKSNNKRVKILGKGEIKKKLTVKAHIFSKVAEEMIKKTGGKIEKLIK